MSYFFNFLSGRRDQIVQPFKPDLIEQGRIHGRFSHVLLGRGSNNTVYTTSGACRIVTDCLLCSNILIMPIWLVFTLSDQPTDQQTDSGFFKSLDKNWTVSGIVHFLS